MELFSQLLSAVTGGGTPTPNDTDHASHDADLPCNPFVPSSTGHSSPRVYVDLSLPPRQSRPRNQKPPSNPELRHPPVSKNKKSVDELRLVADYDIPADRVEVPHPASYFQPRPAMPKPDSAQAFKPYNTLDGHSRHAPPKKPVAYGKSSRIGHNRGEGQKKYLEMQQSKSQGTPARNVLAHHDQTYGFQGVSPTKRRKTVHPPSQPAQYIDITTDEEPSQEMQEIQPPLNSTTPVVRRTTVPRSSHSVRSQRSLENGPAKFGKPSQVEVESASRAVDAVVRASKLKSKSHEHDVHHTTPYGRAKSGSITPNTQLTPIDVEEDYVPSAKAGSIFDGFKQGEIEPATKSREDPGTKTFTSHHFPDARINEHTEENEGQTANTRPVNGTKTNARNNRRVQPRMDEVDPIIDDDLDELSIDITPNKDTAIKRQASPPNTSHTANKSAKRKSRAEKLAPAWPLVFARGHGWESRALVTRDGNLPSLTLERDADEPSMWCIMEAERPDLPSEIKAVILKKDVITVHADDEGRIRLQGPRDQSGNYSIYDLDFQHARDLREFRDTYAVKMTSRQKVIPRDVKTMRTIFQKPLLRNNKVNDSAFGEDSVVVDDSPDAPPPWQSRTPNLDHVMAGSQDSPFEAASNGKHSAASIFAPTRGTVRPARATRSTAPVHDVEEIQKTSDVEKFSVRKGLGPRWLSPLTYVSEHQRAVVNFNDLFRLDEEEMLNDSLIDFYMIYLFDKYKLPKKKVYFFNTYFYTRLTEKTGRSSMNYEAVKRWTNKIDIFEYDYIVVPINEGLHWYLALICNIGNIERKPFLEDFEDETSTVKSKPEDVTIEESTSIAEPTLVEGPKPEEATLPAVHPKDNPEQEDDEDANLFDEQSISLVNPDETDDTIERNGSIHVSSVPQSPREGEPTGQVTQDPQNQGAVSTTVLSALAPSKGTKKKTKRKAPVIKRDPSQPVIIIMDSLCNAHSSAVRALKDWLDAEGLAKRGMNAIITENGVYPKSEQIPAQNNFSDCGVYVLGYVEKFFQGPDEFTHKLLTGEMTAEDDWPKLKVREMRTALRNILFGLAKEQELTVPKKKKKGKKAGQVSNKVPTPPGSQRANTSSRSSPVKQPKPAKVVGMETDPEKHAPTQPNGVAVEPSINELPIPRLGSPIALNSRSHPSALRAESPEITAGKVSDSPPVSMSPPQRATTSPQKHTPGRKKSPEVRVPVKTPNSVRSVGGRDVTVEAARTNGVQQRPGNGASVSPIKKRRKAITDDDESLPSWKAGKSPNPTRKVIDDGGSTRSPASKRGSKSASPEKKRPSSRASASLHDQRDGSSDQPIEIEDSQDVKPEAARSPYGFKTGSPTHRKQPSCALHNTKASLRHAPSVEEIPPPSAQKYRQHSEKNMDDDLLARIDAMDRALSLSHPESSPDDAMDVDSQGVDLMDTSADHEVGETPEAERRSPNSEWTASQPMVM